MRHLIQSREHHVFNVFASLTASSIQSEALTTAESLASLNEEFVGKLETLPLVVAFHSLKSVLGKNEHKLKMLSLQRLAKNKSLF